MKKSKFREEKIIKILKEQEEGKKVDEICRSYGISNATFYSWKNGTRLLLLDRLKLDV